MSESGGPSFYCSLIWGLRWNGEGGRWRGRGRESESERCDIWNKIQVYDCCILKIHTCTSSTSDFASTFSTLASTNNLFLYNDGGLVCVALWSLSGARVFCLASFYLWINGIVVVVVFVVVIYSELSTTFTSRHRSRFNTSMAGRNNLRRVYNRYPDRDETRPHRGILNPARYIRFFNHPSNVSLSLSLSRSLPCTTVNPVVVCSTCKDFCPMATFTGGFCMRGDRTELCMSRAQISINLLSAWLRLLTAPNIHSTSGCVAEELGLWSYWTECCWRWDFFSIWKCGMTFGRSLYTRL